MNRNKREQLILDSAVKIFRRQGFNETTVSEIIDEADVARGTFYLYFKNKDETVLRIIDRYFEDIISALSRLSTSFSENDPRTSLTQIVTALTSQPHWTLFVLKEVGGYKNDFEARIQMLSDQVVRMISHILDDAMASGVIRGINSKIIAQTMLGSIRELALHVAREGIVETEPYIKAAISLFLDGLLPEAPAQAAALPVTEEVRIRSNLAIH